MLYGKPLNGAMFATLVQEYCDALNADKTPVIKNAWDRVADSQCSAAAEAAVDAYRAVIKSAEVHDEPVLDADELEAIDRQAVAAAAAAYRAGAIADSETFAEHESEYLSRNNDVIKAFKRRNTSRAEDLCERLFSDAADRLHRALVSTWQACDCDNLQWHYPSGGCRVKGSIQLLPSVVSCRKHCPTRLTVTLQKPRDPSHFSF
jgi:hypothetical protein